MLNYIIKRLFLIIPTLLGILAVNFLIIQAAPGGPVEKAIAQIKGTDMSVTERFTSSGGEQLSNNQSQKKFNPQESKYRGSQGIDPDLIKELEKHPEWEVTVSVDISKNEDENDRRAFGEQIIEVINENSSNQFTICFDGYDNYNCT